MTTGRSARVLLATAADAWPLDEDGPALLGALEAAGVRAAAAVWDDPSVDWAAADLVVVRSTWDYVPRLGEFLAWADAVGAVTDLHNPPPVLRWNTDKRYLADLAGAGLPVVPTAWVQPGEEPQAALDAAHEMGGATGEVVVKPAVSAGSKDTARVDRSQAGEARRLVAHIHASGRTAMVQPYLASVDARGETGIVLFDGRPSHAFCKAAMLGPGSRSVTGLYAPERITPRRAGAAELDLAARVVDEVVRRFGVTPLHCRVDLLADDRGEPVVVEVELTEPSWFLATDAGAAARAAAAIAARLAL